MKQKLIFFNHWRNGDTFLNRSYVRDICSKLYKEYDFYYAHNNHESITQDLPCKKVTLDKIPQQISFWHKFAKGKNDNSMYINTWIGCWIGVHMKEGEHANFITVYKAWCDIYRMLNLEPPTDYYEFLPQLDLDYFNLKPATKWLDDHDKRPFILICNGQQQSEQSNMGNMRYIIDLISSDYPEYDFLICDKLNIEKSNVFYTDDIFGGSTGNLPHISYMSNFSKLIIGKNSGPFSFSHTYLNNLNPNQTFLCFSKEMKHCLAGEGDYHATHLFSDTVNDDEAIQIIINTIETLNESRDNIRRPIKRVIL
ncbi:hypothetical protein EBU71_09605 [bacterium]|nr:hypothetical protein [Candidatus Elulimicrobium humile]